jgi:predicted kinase
LALECVIFVGLPASGKTSLYRERFAGTHDHVSKDLMRHARHPEGRQRRLLSESLASGRSVVVDDTNPSAAVRAPIITLAREHGAEVIGYFFETSAGDALRRNRARQGRERSRTSRSSRRENGLNRQRAPRDSTGFTSFGCAIRKADSRS